MPVLRLSGLLFVCWGRAETNRLLLGEEGECFSDTGWCFEAWEDAELGSENREGGKILILGLG